MSTNLSWTFLIGLLTLNISPCLLSIIIISGLVGNWLFAIGWNTLCSNYESSCAISATGKPAVRIIKSAAHSNEIEPWNRTLSYRHHNAIDSYWCSKDILWSIGLRTCRTLASSAYLARQVHSFALLAKALQNMLSLVLFLLFLRRIDSKTSKQPTKFDWGYILRFVWVEETWLPNLTQVAFPSWLHVLYKCSIEDGDGQSFFAKFNRAHVDLRKLEPLSVLIESSRAKLLYFRKVIRIQSPLLRTLQSSAPMSWFSGVLLGMPSPPSDPPSYLNSGECIGQWYILNRCNLFLNSRCKGNSALLQGAHSP